MNKIDLFVVLAFFMRHVGCWDSFLQNKQILEGVSYMFLP